MTSPSGWAPGDPANPYVIPDAQDPYWPHPDASASRLGYAPDESRQPRHAAPETPDLNRSEAQARRSSAWKRREAVMVQVAVPAILADLLATLPDLLHCVWLCHRCRQDHFLPHPDMPGRPCNRVECQCWCSQGTGQ